MLGSLESLAWDVLAIVIANYIYDHFFNDKM